MKKTIALILLVAMVFSLSITSFAAGGTWKSSEYGWWYQREDGSFPANSWENIDGKYYYFDEYGLVQTGWLCDEGNYYYLDPYYGYAQGGWLEYNGNYYYLDPYTGIAQGGWLEYKGNYYYLDPYYGNVQTGWLEYNGYWYYLDPTTGKAVAGTQVTIDGKTYEFDSAGRCVKEVTSSSISMQEILAYIMNLLSSGGSGSGSFTLSGPQMTNVRDIITTITFNISQQY